MLILLNLIRYKYRVDLWTDFQMTDFIALAALIVDQDWNKEFLILDRTIDLIAMWIGNFLVNFNLNNCSSHNQVVNLLSK